MSIKGVCNRCGKHKKLPDRGICRNCNAARVREQRKADSSLMRKYNAKRKKEFPWLFTYGQITARCGRKPAYKNIKCLISLEELKTLWFRDKAYLLKRPSIDRIDSSKDYTFDNCRYIELAANIQASSLARWKKEKSPGFVRPIKNIKFNCKRCNKEIIIHSYNQDYCPECKIILRREHQKRLFWLKKDRQQILQNISAQEKGENK